MHIADIDKGMLGANGVVGSNIPVATGVALSASVRGSDQVSVVFFGDGASSQGSLHESMNLASIWKLPILFVCENNRYAEATPFEYSVAGASISKRAAGYDMPGVTVDGQSLPDVYAAAGEAVRRARAGEGPTLIEAQTYRYQGHFGADNPLGYRTEEEEAYYRDRDWHRQAQSARAGRGIRNGGRVVRHRRERGRRGRRCDQVRRREPVSRLTTSSPQTCTCRTGESVSRNRFTAIRRRDMTTASQTRRISYIQAVNEALRPGDGARPVRHHNG